MINEKSNINIGTPMAEKNKSESLAQAISNIDSVDSHLIVLINKINGEEEPGDDSPKNMPRHESLAVTLSEGAGNINQKCDDLHKKIDEIFGMLF